MQFIDKLLSAKMSPPRIGLETIWRKRLIENFNEHERVKLTIVSAPTGYGKTVLISQFASLKNNPVVWYQLDEFDNDLILFIRYFINAISNKIPQYGIQTLDFIKKNEDISKQIRAIVTLLVNELEARAKEGLTFILDDYHLINEKMIHKFIEELIQYIPEGVHLVISSRYELPFNLVRLKSHGLVNEITYNHLKFSKDEVKLFFNSQRESGITEELVEKYQFETGGWAVALSLLKASSLKSNNKENLIFQRKNHEDIYNYFAEEVFRELPIEFQTFLMSTSVIDVLTPDICNALTKREDSNDMLEKIIKQNIFLIKLEDKEDTYRYHHLFQEFLQANLGDKKKALFEKVGEYFVNKEYYEQAVEYFILAGLFEKAVFNMEEIGIQMIKFGKWQTINRWLQKIPKSFKENSPQLMLLRGAIYNQKGMWSEALFQIDKAIELFVIQDNKIYLHLLNAHFFKAVVLRRAGQLLESLEVLNKILIDSSHLPLIEWYDMILEKVNTLLWSGAFKEAAETLKWGIKFAQRDGEHRLIAYFMEHLGATYYTMGDYHKAIKYYESSMEEYLPVYNSLTEFEKERYSQRTTLARIYRDWGELDKALKLIQEEIDTKERLGLIDDLPRAYHQLALIYNDLGDKETAEKYFEHADQMYEKLERRDFQWTWHLALYGKILLDNGKTKKGISLIDKAIKYSKQNSEFNLALCEFVGCYAYINDGNIDKGLKLLKHALEVGEKVGAKNLICQCCWALSNIYLKMGIEKKAKEYALQCFTLAREGNYLQIFLSYEQTSFPIIKLGLEMGIEEDFLNKIVSRLGSKADASLLALVKNKDILSNEEPDKEEVLKVYCFGNFEVYGKGESKPVQWKTTKAMELFAYFIKNANQTISKEKILEDLWPDMNPEQTTKWLHTYVYQIRSAMKKFGMKDNLVYKNKAYSLKATGINSDADRFETFIHHSMTEENDHSIECLAKAILLYRGEYLEGWYNKWIMEEKNRLEHIYLTALERLSGLYMEEEEYSYAVNCLLLILKTNPLSENAHEMLINIYEKTGNRMAIINQYEEYCRIIKNELGIEPKEEIKDLYDKYKKDK